MLLLLAMGCTDEEERVRDFFERLAGAQCERTMACCSRDELSRSFSPPLLDYDDCVLRWLLSPGDRTHYEVLAREGYLELHEEYADACVAAMAGGDCRGLPWEPTYWYIRNLLCAPDRVFTGLVQEGQLCVNTYVCQAGQYCRSTHSGSTSQMGTCARLPGKGEKCGSVPGKKCQPGLACGSPSGWTCQPLAEEGQPCVPACNSNKDPKLYCHHESGKQSLCRKKKVNGASCTADQECGSGFCDARNVHIQPWKCGPNPTPPKSYTGLCDGR